MPVKVEITTLEPKKKKAIRMTDVDLSDFKSNPDLWDILVQTTKENPLYNNLAGYYRDKILPENPHLTTKELMSKLSISKGMAMVILAENAPQDSATT